MSCSIYLDLHIVYKSNNVKKKIEKRMTYILERKQNTQLFCNGLFCNGLLCLDWSEFVFVANARKFAPTLPPSSIPSFNIHFILLFSLSPESLGSSSKQAFGPWLLLALGSWSSSWFLFLALLLLFLFVLACS
jgi:hypothetical protein